MRLLELSADFVKMTSARSYQTVPTLAEADGVMFQCPKCAEGKERGSEVEDWRGDDWPNGKVRHFVRGAHMVLCWFRGHVPDDLDPKPGRWTPSGSSLEDLTFVPGEPPMAVSVLLTGGCNWHGFVRAGEATPS
jgi:hypothetical protein